MVTLDLHQRKNLSPPYEGGAGGGARKLRHHDRHGRRTLLWVVGVFFGLQLAAGVVLDHYWPEVRFPTAGRLWRMVQDCPRSPDIVFLGSSRFGMGVSDKLINESLKCNGRALVTFNASTEAGDLVTAEYMLSSLEERGVRPRQVVIEISPETVTRYNRWVMYHIRRQITWTDMSSFVPDAVQESQLSRLLQARLTPLFMHRREILKPAATALASVCSRDSQHQPSSDLPAVLPLSIRQYDSDDPTDSRHGLIEVPRWLRDYEAGGGPSEAALQRILHRCEQRGVKVTLVGCPVASAHRALYTPAIEAKYQAHIERLVKEHRCTYVDYRAKVSDSYFVDHHHLSRRGCRLLSDALTQEVLLPGWGESMQARR
jgi:hypothetical protein